MNKENSGCAVLNKDCSDLTHKTVIVLGVPRGGTSMVAGVLAKLGVYMGPEFRLAPIYENRELDIFIEGNTKSLVKKKIARYNELHATWGIKILPQSWFFWLFQVKLRQPVFVVVFRDVMAISKRRVILFNRTILRELFFANCINLGLCLFLMCTKRPAFLLSYEKALLNPGDYVAALSSFLGIDDAKLISDAIKFVQPSSPDYVTGKHIVRQLDANATLFGYVDLIDATKIVGWALSLTDPKPLAIELFINGQSKYVVRADQLRSDVKAADARFREFCGFSIELSDQEKLQAGDCVEIKVFENNIHLINSPFTVKKDAWMINIQSIKGE